MWHDIFAGRLQDCRRRGHDNKRNRTNRKQSSNSSSNNNNNNNNNSKITARHKDASASVPLLRSLYVTVRQIHEAIPAKKENRRHTAG